MTWPWISRRVHEIEIAARARELAEVSRERSYWQARAELFIDRATARAGITHEPVMRHAETAGVPIDPFAGNPFAGLGINEIDSSRSDGKRN